MPNFEAHCWTKWKCAFFFCCDEFEFTANATAKYFSSQVMHSQTCRVLTGFISVPMLNDNVQINNHMQKQAEALGLKTGHTAPWLHQVSKIRPRPECSPPGWEPTRWGHLSGSKVLKRRALSAMLLSDNLRLLWFNLRLFFFTHFLINYWLHLKCYFVKIFIPLCAMLDSCGCSSSFLFCKYCLTT